MEAKRKKLKDVEREAIIRGLNQGVSIKELGKIFNVGRTTILMCKKRFGDRKSFTDAPRPGRPRNSDNRTRRAIKFLSVKDPTKTGVEITEEMVERGVDISKETVKRTLRENGLFGRRPAIQPFISVKNRRVRVAFTKSHLYWTSNDWGKVLFSD